MAYCIGQVLLINTRVPTISRHFWKPNKGCNTIQRRSRRSSLSQNGFNDGTSSRSGAYYTEEGNYGVRFRYGASSFGINGFQSESISVEYHIHFDKRQHSMPSKVGVQVMTSLTPNLWYRSGEYSKQGHGLPLCHRENLEHRRVSTNDPGIVCLCLPARHIVRIIVFISDKLIVLNSLSKAMISTAKMKGLHTQ